MIDKIWVFMILLSVIGGGAAGRIANVSAAAVEGTTKAVELVFSLIGVICFWSGMMEIMTASGAAAKIASFIRPLLKPIFGKVAEDKEASEYISSNITANLLGLGNAATPIGLKAAARIHELDGKQDAASHSLIALVVLNTASLQLIPTTVAGIRAALGAKNPYDILPAVWIASVCSVFVGLMTAHLFRKFRKDSK